MVYTCAQTDGTLFEVGIKKPENITGNQVFLNAILKCEIM